MQCSKSLRKCSTCSFCFLVTIILITSLILVTNPKCSVPMPESAEFAARHSKQAEFVLNPSAELKISQTTFPEMIPSGITIDYHAYSKEEVIFIFILHFSLSIPFLCRCTPKRRQSFSVYPSIIYVIASCYIKK